jgi:hypothetical protein
MPTRSVSFAYVLFVGAAAGLAQQGQVEVSFSYIPLNDYKAAQGNQRPITPPSNYSSPNPPPLQGSFDGPGDHPGAGSYLQPFLRGCVKEKTIQQCVLDYFNIYVTDNYKSQGVRGIRFMIPLSDAFAANGSTATLRQTWLNNLNDFFKDLSDSGVTKISPAFIIDSWGAHGFTMVPRQGAPGINCGDYICDDNTPVRLSLATTGPEGPDQQPTCGGLPLRFVRWLPYGFVHSPGTGCDGWVDGAFWGGAYQGASANPYFPAWGEWTLMLSLFEEIVQRATATS